MEQNVTQVSSLPKPFIKVSKEEQRTELSKRKDPEEKYYVILIRSDVEDFDYTWRECIGRTETYEEARSLAVDGQVDLKRSIVLVEGNGLENSLSLLYFLSYMSKAVFNDPNFNIHDYCEEEEIVASQNFNPTRPEGSNPLDVMYGALEGEDI